MPSGPHGRTWAEPDEYFPTLTLHPRRVNHHQSPYELELKPLRYDTRNRAWFVPNGTKTRHLKYKDGKGKLCNATGVLCDVTIVIVKGKKRRLFYKALCAFTGVQFVEVGIIFDYGSSERKQIIHHGSDALSTLMNGKYDMKGQKWGLTLIMRSDLGKIKIEKGGRRGFVPKSATLTRGKYRLTAILNKELASEMAYVVSKRRRCFWYPGKGLPFFEVHKDGNFYRFRETSYRPDCRKYKICRLKVEKGVEGPKP